MRFTLHYAPGTIAAASALTLLESGLECAFVRVDFSRSAQQSAAYLRINPKGRVPALETPDGILTETGAILEYIAAQVPEKNLVPSDPFAAARMREMMFYLASTMHVNHAHKLRGHRWADAETSHRDMTAKVPETMAASCAWVETRLSTEFVAGDTISLADFYLYTVATWLRGDGVEIANTPRLARHFERLTNRPSTQQARALGILPEIPT